MRTFTAFLALIAAVLFLGGSAAADNKYVGAKFCGMCHKMKEKGEAYAMWEKSAHAKAFETLKTKEADEFAKKRGLKTPAAESPECLKCHVTGGGAAANVEPTFKKEEGVTCEACHGAASAYKMIHTKGDLAKSKEAGLFLPDKTDAKFCEKCHNAESPTFKGFKIAEMWAKIEHHGPPKK
jgi:nitrate/TMAO reductase-like tetraheme cytochrome c subunit